MNIRFATDKDYPRLLDLWRQIDRYHAEALPGFFQAPEGTPRDVLYFQTVMENGRILLAEEDDALLGAAQVIIRQTEDINILVPRRHAHVEMLVVAENTRQQGIGRALMLTCEEWGRSQGMSEIDLTVFEFNAPAIKLYESLGYKTYSRKMGKRL